MRSVGRGSLWDDLVLLRFESHIQMIEQKNWAGKVFDWFSSIRYTNWKTLVCNLLIMCACLANNELHFKWIWLYWHQFGELYCISGKEKSRKSLPCNWCNSILHVLEYCILDNNLSSFLFIKKYMRFQGLLAIYNNSRF